MIINHKYIEACICIFALALYKIVCVCVFVHQLQNSEAFGSECDQETCDSRLNAKLS